MNFRNTLEHLIQQGDIKGHLGEVPNFMRVTENDLCELEANIQFDMGRNEAMLSRSKELAVNRAI